MVPLGDRLYGWSLKLGRVDYDKALNWQHGLVKMRREGMARDSIILVEHPNVITVGRDGHDENYAGLEADIHKVERGGDVTYHGPGQLVVYFIFNLSRRGRDLHQFMTGIQTGIIQALSDYKVKGEMGDEHTGIWVGKNKIASIGIAVKSWITFHGAAINLNTELEEFKKINPCGLDANVMTSVSKQTGNKINLDEFGDCLLAKYDGIFNTSFDEISLDFLAEDVESQAGGSVI